MGICRGMGENIPPITYLVEIDLTGEAFLAPTAQIEGGDMKCKGNRKA